MMSFENRDFLAYRVVKTAEGKFSRSLQNMNTKDLPDGDVIIQVRYSGLNYKDALSAYGRPGVTRNYPHTSGIDAAGVVEWCATSEFAPGDEVLVTSYDLGMETDGGFGQYIRVPSNWVISRPAGMSLKDTMIAGTAGLTAAQGVYNLLEAGQDPKAGPVVVTGARGAVGSFAVSLLSHLGFEVIAAVSKIRDDTQELLELGASDVIDSGVTDDQSGKALLKPLWAGGFDTIGDNILSTLIKACKYGGNIICVGNIQSGNLVTTVYPFIIRGIKLIGVATQDTPMPLRRELWGLLAGEWKVPSPDKFITEIGLDELDKSLERMINKSSRGKILLDLWR